MLVKETGNFLERNSAFDFFFWTWFIHESEQSNQMRKSPKWKLHVCLKVLWLDPFPDILLLGSCTGVSDTHRSAPLPSDVGHQRVAPVLLPHLQQNLCEWIRTETSVKGRGGTAQSWTDVQTPGVEVWLWQQFNHVLPGSKQNDTL